MPAPPPVTEDPDNNAPVGVTDEDTPIDIGAYIGTLKWVVLALVVAIVLGVCYSSYRRKERERERQAALRIRAALETQNKNAPPKPSTPRKSFAD